MFFSRSPAVRPASTAKRAANIDLCRGLLFVLMANTHALTLAGIGPEHWLFSDGWLPSGWATQVFVVLSGFSVGFLCGSRTDLEAVERALTRRAGQILLVMLISNTVFAVLREAMGGHLSNVFTLAWWWGMVTLTTAWTISGVLLPTALVVVCGVYLSRVTRREPWNVLAVLVAARLLASMSAAALGDSPYASWWIVRFLMLEGLGGFPVLPFFLNGCIGIWLGMLRNHNNEHWRIAMGGLMATQILVYLTSYGPPSYASSVFVGSLSAASKFAWMYWIAHLVKLGGPSFGAAPIELVGKFALGSFVMHRVFLQVLNVALATMGLARLAPELRYVIILGGTLLLCWWLCIVRTQVAWIDQSFRRVAM